MAQDSTKPATQVEGEGSYTATRRYNQHLGDAIDAGDVETAAEEARRAVEGPEREELERAEQQGKAGPKAKQEQGKAGPKTKTETGIASSRPSKPSKPPSEA